MEANRIADLPASIRGYPYGWQIAIPAEMGTLLGHPVTVNFDTRSTPGKEPPPVVTPDEADLAATILARFGEVLREVEARFTEACERHRDDGLEQIASPHVWICRDDPEKAGTRHWAFAIERRTPHAVHGDYVTLVEFDGLTFLRVWSGS